MCCSYVSTCPRCITLQGLLLWGIDSNLRLFNRALVNVSNSFEFRVVLKKSCCHFEAFSDLLGHLNDVSCLLLVSKLLQNNWLWHSDDMFFFLCVWDKIRECSVLRLLVLDESSAGYLWKSAATVAASSTTGQSCTRSNKLNKLSEGRIKEVDMTCRSEAPQNAVAAEIRSSADLLHLVYIPQRTQGNGLWKIPPLWHLRGKIMKIKGRVSHTATACIWYEGSCVTFWLKVSLFWTCY